MREAERGEVTEQIRGEADKRECMGGEERRFWGRRHWIKRGSGKRRMGFRGILVS